MADVPALLTAGTLALTSIGGGFVWLVTWVQHRFEKVEKKLAQCERREKRQLKINGTQLAVIEMLWRECERFGDGPANAVLARSDKLLDDLKRRTVRIEIDGKDEE
jgi:hypothetical protein